MTRVLSLREFMGLADHLPEMIERAAIRGLRSAALRGVGEVGRQIKQADPYPAVDTAAMLQSVIAEPISDGAELSVGTPQAAWMEFGTRPHMPPLGPILTWVTRKFGLGVGTSGRKQRKTRAKKFGPKEPPKQGPKLPPRQGPRINAAQGKAHRQQKASMRYAEQQQRDADNLRRALAIANKVRWKIFRHGTAPRGFFAKAMVTIRSKYARREIRHELKALEKRL